MRQTQSLCELCSEDRSLLQFDLSGNRLEREFASAKVMGCLKAEAIGQFASGLFHSIQTW